LPHYDCYVIGAGTPGRQRSHLVPEAAGKRIFDRGAGPFPVVLIDGVAAGTWSRKERGKRLEIRVEPFRRLTAAERDELRAEADRIGRFLGTEAVFQAER
jgi:hypothetical protein